MIFYLYGPPYQHSLRPPLSAHEGRREWERKIMNTTDHTTTDKKEKKEKKSGLGYIHFQHKKGSKNSSLIGLKHESNTYYVEMCNVLIMTMILIRFRYVS